MMKEKLLAYIRILQAYILMTIIKALWILPLDRDSILFLSFDGKQYSDSPKYICEYIYDQLGKKKKYIWALNEPDNFKDIVPAWCITIPRQGFKFIIQFVKSGTIVTNNFLHSYYPVRKKQIVLNTWHGGSPLKTCGMADVSSGYYDRLFYSLHEKKYTAFISSSSFMTEEVFKKSLGYHGTVIPVGMPRNAILFDNNTKIVKERVYKYFGLHNDGKTGIALYAPTFRGSANQGSFLNDKDKLDMNEVIKTLNVKYHKTFIILFRAHHAMSDAIENANVISATDYPDMQELLIASDILITDYSSCMGDMALTKKPVFLYTPDLKEYMGDRGFYWSIYDQPFPVALTQNDFIKNIITFDLNKYIKGIDSYLKKLGSYENPLSMEKTYEWLNKQWYRLSES